MTLEDALVCLRAYPRPATIMEVCGTHTSAIIRGGIHSLLPPHVRLVSGPGCPVCVTPAACIDRLIEACHEPDTCVLSYGDLFRVPGTHGSLADAKAAGGACRVIYSPLEALPLAKAHADTRFVVAAVGFETTIPAYAVLLEALEDEGVANVRLVTALRTMPAAMDYLCAHDAADAYICPGHVSSVIGSAAFEPLAVRYAKPFVVAGFDAEHIIAALHRVLTRLMRGSGGVDNLYASAVTEYGNAEAQSLMARFFTPAEGHWRGIGRIPGSALSIRADYNNYVLAYDDMGDEEAADGCRCGDVLMGRITPDSCPLFGTACRPEHPVGACMVSGEGACGIWHGAMGDGL